MSKSYNNQSDYDPNCRLVIKNLPENQDPNKMQKLLLELSTQVAPVYKISMDKKLNRVYIDFVYDDSVIYAKECLAGTTFFGSNLNFDFAEGSSYLGSKSQSFTPNGFKPTISRDYDRTVSPSREKEDRALNSWKKSSSSNSKNSSSRGQNSKSSAGQGWKAPNNSGSGSSSREQNSRNSSSEVTSNNNSPNNLSKIHQPSKTPLFKIRNQQQQQQPNFPAYGIQNGSLVSGGKTIPPMFVNGNMPVRAVPPMYQMRQGGNPMMVQPVRMQMPTYYQNQGQAMGQSPQGGQQRYYR